MGIGARIAAARKRARISQDKLGTLVGAGQTTVSSWERGRTEPSRDDVRRIAEAIGVPAADLELGDGDDGFRATVPLVGYVGAGAMAHYYASADEGLGEVDAPDDATDTTVAVEVRGTSLGPIFETWLIFYDDVRSPVTPDLHGELCVVGLPDGRVLVKRLRSARGAGFYHWESNAEETIFDQEVSWAAKVKSMRPR